MTSNGRVGYGLSGGSRTQGPGRGGGGEGGGGGGRRRREGENDDDSSRIATKEDWESMRILFQMVVRQFYEDVHVIMIDIVSKHQAIPQDILANALGVQGKEVLAIANKLKNDRLLEIYRRSEARDNNHPNSTFNRSVTRNYFFIDPKTFLDVTKWRIAKMRSQIDSLLRNELDNKGYMCPRCRKSFSTLDVARLLDPVTMSTFVCDVPGCGNELVDNEDAEDVKRGKDRLRRFNIQLEPIMARLRKTDGIALPEFDPAAIVAREGGSDAWRLRAARRNNPKASLADVMSASDGGRAGVLGGPTVSIDMGTIDPEAEAAHRAEKEAETERMREQNALPIWLQKDALGQHVSSQRKEGVWQQDGKKTSATGTTGSAKEDGEKGSGNMEDYYAQYASMAAEDEDEDEAGDMEEVDVGGLESVSGPSGSQTPVTSGQISGKRSREESFGAEYQTHDNGGNNKKMKKEQSEDEEEDDLEFDEVA